VAGPLLHAALAAAMGYVSALMFGWGARQTWYAHRSVSWPTVEGRVTHSAVQEGGGVRGGPSYFPDVRYVYTVRGHEYAAARVAFGQEGSGREPEATALAARFPVGRAVAVRYDPADPAIATLLSGTINSLHLVAWVIGLMGLLFSGLGLVQALVNLR
jgi:Protein of unknown function (DUF3592)